jgi:hypothetical protein
MIYMGQLTANISRPDVGTAFPGYGDRHGFEGTLPITATLYHPDGTYFVCASADYVGAGGVRFRKLPCQTLDYMFEPFGWLDSTGVARGVVQIQAWAIDPDTSAPTHVHVYVDGKFVRQTIADVVRPDVGATFAGYGDRHGFSVTVPRPAGRGEHEVCLHAINVGVGATNPVLGCGVVIVGSPPRDCWSLALGLVRGCRTVPRGIGVRVILKRSRFTDLHSLSLQVYS